MTITQELEVIPNLDLDLVEKTLNYESHRIAENTRRAYMCWWKRFVSWCNDHSICCLPVTAEAISAYISDIAAESSTAKIDASIAAIQFVHKERGVEIAGDKKKYSNVRKGIKRLHPEKSLKKKAKALSIMDLLTMGREATSSMKDVRDKAIILLAFFAALRRSEVVGLDYEHVKLGKDGVELLFLHTKTSDEPVSIKISRARNENICPVKALETWIERSWIRSGALFRTIGKSGIINCKRMSGEAVSIITKDLFGDEYSGHSMRRGLITAEAQKGISVYDIAKHSRHKDFNVLMGYVEEENAFEKSTTNMLGV